MITEVLIICAVFVAGLGLGWHRGYSAAQSRYVFACKIIISSLRALIAHNKTEAEMTGMLDSVSASLDAEVEETKS